MPRRPAALGERGQLALGRLVHVDEVGVLVLVVVHIGVAWMMEDGVENAPSLAGRVLGVPRLVLRPPPLGSVFLGVLVDLLDLKPYCSFPNFS